MLVYHADTFFHGFFGGMKLHFLSLYQYFPLGGSDFSIEHLHQCGLACSIFP